jgi:hypothetical protein
VKRIVTSLLVTLLFLIAAVPASALEGCKKKRPIELFQQVYLYYFSTPTGTNPGARLNGWPPDCDPSTGMAGVCWSAGTSWVPKETGETCITFSATLNLSTIMDPTTHGPSATMQAFLEGNFSMGSFTRGDTFTPFSQQVWGGTSCTPHSHTEYWDDEFSNGATLHYPVKVWNATEGGQGCESTVTVAP